MTIEQTDAEEKHNEVICAQFEAMEIHKSLIPFLLIMIGGGAGLCDLFYFFCPLLYFV